MSKRRPLPSVHQLFINVRIALWRRYRYRSLLDVPKDFLFRSASDARDPRPAAISSRPLVLNPKELSDPVYLRVANSDFAVFEEIFDRHVYAIVKEWDLPARATIIDLGANIGLASLYFWLAKPQASIVAVEPDDENCRLLRRNCKRLLEQNRLTVHTAFIAAQNGVAGIDRGESSWAYAKVDSIDKNYEPVACISMLQLLADSGFEQVDLLKCDVEGSEREVFADCAPWIGKVRHLVCETHKPYLNADLLNDLRSAGWDFEILREEQHAIDGLVYLRRRT